MHKMFKNLSPRKFVLDVAGYLKEESNSVVQKKGQQ